MRILATPVLIWRWFTNPVSAQTPAFVCAHVGMCFVNGGRQGMAALATASVGQAAYVGGVAGDLHTAGGSVGMNSVPGGVQGERGC